MEQVLSEQQTNVGAPVWIDQMGGYERRVEKMQQELTRRSQTALSVYRRRIETLKREREALRSQLLEVHEDYGQQLVEAEKQAQIAGHEAGRMEARRELAQRFKLLLALEDEFRSQALEYHKDSDVALVKLCTHMVKRVLGRAPELLEGNVLRSMRELLQHWVGESSYRYRLHPDDRRELLESGGMESLIEESGNSLEVLASPEIPPGSCQLELASGLIDAAPEAMLNEIEKNLLQALVQHRDEDDVIKISPEQDHGAEGGDLSE